MKQKVKLTESQLRNMIVESVKTVLSELDWKTYRNAQEKARERGDDRDYKFGWASNAAFRRDWLDDIDGVRKDTDDGTRFSTEPSYDEYGNYGYQYSGPKGKRDGFYYDDVLDYGDYDKEQNGNEEGILEPYELKNKGYSPEDINKIEAARREIRRYRNGKYQFDKEKGWGTEGDYGVYYDPRNPEARKRNKPLSR